MDDNRIKEINLFFALCATLNVMTKMFFVVNPHRVKLPPQCVGNVTK